MTLLDRLRLLGSRLRILEPSADAPRATVAPIATRAVTLAELTREIRAEEVRALAEAPAELTIDFSRLYAAAGLGKPAHGWDAERLAAVLASPALEGKPRDIVQRTLAQMLAIDHVAAADVVADVIARDQALDAYERFAASKLREREQARARRHGELDAQIAALESERRQLDGEAEADRERWHAWLQRKRASERALADAIGYLVDRPVVTVDEEPG